MELLLNGSDYIADTSAHTGEWKAIQVLETTVFTKLIGNMSSPAPTLTAGTYTGIFTEIQLASGKVVAYRR